MNNSDGVRVAPAIDARWRFAVAACIDWPPHRSLFARLLSLL